jgi:hypothetical protein
MGMKEKALQPKRDVIPVKRKPHTNKSLSPVEQQYLMLITQLTKLDKNIRAKKFEVINSKKAAKRLADEVRMNMSRKNDQSEEDLQLMAKHDVSIATQIDLLSMIDWTKTIPEFNELPLGERIFLTKRFSSHYLTLENGFFTAIQNRNTENIYLICNGSYMPRELSMIKDKVRIENLLYPFL